MTEQNEKTDDARAIAEASEQTSRVQVLYYACNTSEENGPWEVHADRSCLAASPAFRTGADDAVEHREVPVMVLLLGLIQQDMEREPFALLHICRCVKGAFGWES